MCEQHDGRLPDDLASLLALPGIGPYTARAVLVFAYERNVGLVDTNAGRFVARAPGGAIRVGTSEAQAIADAAVPHGHAWAWGQAVFDLGAIVCTKREPDCHRCPIARHCAWRQAGVRHRIRSAAPPGSARRSRRSRARSVRGAGACWPA